MREREKIIKDLIQDEYFQRLLIDPDQDCLVFWKRWVNENSERKSCFEEAKKILQSIEYKTDPLSVDQKELMWGNIISDIEVKQGAFSTRRRILVRSLVYGVAASFALVLIGTFVFHNYLKSQNKPVRVVAKQIEKEAPKGKISSFKFEDGTIVKLFSGTKIKYPEKFNVNFREVYVEGEAFFDVSKNKDKPFIVKTNSLVATVLGTTFNVRTYDNENCDISLVTGKVKVEKVDKSIETLNEILLEPGEEATLKNSSMVKQVFDVEEKTAWKDGYIYLENKSFDESIEILKRWYHIDFEVRNQEKSIGKNGTGKFKNQSLRNILDVIGYSFDFTFELSEDKVYIKF